MPDRPSFPVPENLTPDTYCLCIQMPNDPTWKTVIAGLLWQPAEWFNWQRDDAKSGTVLAHYWRELFAQIDWSNMSCCCDEIPLSRFTSEGIYQTSNDGGVTWVDNPNADPRNISPQLPPIATTGNPADDKCRSATNVNTAMSSAIETFGAELGTVGSILALALAIVSAIVGVFAVPPSATVLIPIVIALAQAIYAIASGTYLALFTSTVYNDLQCILYCNCDSSGTFSEQNYRDILTAIDGGGFDSNVALTFTSVISGWGVHGLNDAARGGSTETGDCTDCDCPQPCPSNWQLFSDFVALGQTIEYGDDWVQVVAYPVSSTTYVILQTDTVANCCQIDSFETISGESSGFHGWTDCGHAVSEYVPQFTTSSIDDLIGKCCDHIYLNFNGPCTIRIHFTPCG